MSELLPLLETNLDGVRAFHPFHPNFNAATASQGELEAQGLPPRPDPKLSPRLHEQWIDFWSRPMKRLIPKFERMAPSHGPARDVVLVENADTSQSASSSNWSGVIIQDPSNPFARPGVQIAGSWRVPKPTCIGVSDGPYASCCWVGIDGWGSNDVFQCGTESDSNCGSDSPLSTYFWTEWFPAYQARVTNLPANPGDNVRVCVYISPTGTYYVSYFNDSDNSWGFTVEMTPPPGVTLVGNCVEWILERTTVNGATSQLAYIGNVLMSGYEYFTNDAGQTLESYPGFAANGALIEVSMVDSQGQVLSLPYIAGSGSSSQLLCMTYAGDQ